MLGRSGIKVQIVPVVLERGLSCADPVHLLCVQLGQDFIGLPAGEIRAEKFRLVLGVPVRPMGLISGLNACLWCNRLK